MHPALISMAATGVGSLPHRDADQAAEFSLRHTPRLAFVPALPRRSPAEGMIAQAVVGIAGVSVGPYGGITVNVERLNPDAPVITDIDHDAYGGLRAFLDAAQGRAAPVKWQFTGPITLGLALLRAGVEPRVAFAVATKAVRSHVRAVQEVIAERLPDCPQLMVIDEPEAGALAETNFPMPTDRAIDLLSSSLAAVEGISDEPVNGVHCCGEADWASLIAAGPAVLSIPARPSMFAIAGYLNRFLSAGGWIMWGAIPTDGPLVDAPKRLWTQLSSLTDGLVERGCDPDRLARQAMLSPACGLGLHSESVAERVFTLLGQLSSMAAARL